MEKHLNLLPPEPGKAAGIKEIISDPGHVCVWERLKSASKPIALYGMGDGAEKIMRVCARRGIKISGVFASDEFVRGHSFCGFPVLTLKQTEERFGDFIILLGFGSALPHMLEKFYELSSRYELYSPDVPLAGDQNEIFDRSYALLHSKELESAYGLLADSQSKKVFSSVIKFKITGNIDFLRECETPRTELFEIIRPAANEVFIDLGAYNGDTVLEFSSLAASCRGVAAVEPDRKNYKRLCKNLETLKSPESLLLVNAPAWDSPRELEFGELSSRGSAVSSGGSKQTKGRGVTAITVDSLLRGELPGGTDCKSRGVFPKRATYIKADVEGCEARALLGAQETIKNCSPRLAVSAYHRNDDLFALPALIHKLNPRYKLYLRHHPYVPAWETNIYAVN